jgi:hypothetical protein
MKIIGKRLGCVVVGTELDYNFCIVSDDCSLPYPGITLDVHEIIGGIEIEPRTIKTDSDGRATVKVRVLPHASGTCHFAFRERGTNERVGH